MPWRSAAQLRTRPSFLMVGTVEPRKGHRQALAAIEKLWATGRYQSRDHRQEGVEDRRSGEADQNAPKHNNRLFWLQGVSDEMLDHVYRSAHALLAASEGEGFGLPLIEAAHYGLPIIARDIPVFREVAGEHAYYFHGETARSRGRTTDLAIAWRCRPGVLKPSVVDVAAKQPSIARSRNGRPSYNLLVGCESHSTIG